MNLSCNFLSVFTEKEEKIKKEKEQGTYKEKVSVLVKHRVSQAVGQGLPSLDCGCKCAHRSFPSVRLKTLFTE